MKRVFFLLICFTLIFALCGCEKVPAENSKNTSDTLHTASDPQSAIVSSEVTVSGSSSKDSEPSSKTHSSVPAQSSQVSTAPVSSVAPTVPESAAQKLLKGMTAEEKVAQLFIICPEDLNLTTEDKAIAGAVTAVNSNIIAALGRYPVGGVIMFAANTANPSQLKSLMDAFKQNARTPLFLSVDEEGGNVARLANNPAFGLTNFGSALYLETKEKVFSTYNYIGGYLGSYGFNLDFAPVADIYTNSANTVIGSRAFGRDAATVTTLLPEAIKGLENNGIIPCIKHFPGHGDTLGDTHNGVVTLNKTWEQLNATEIVPFKNAIEKGVEMIMAAHITLPNATKEALPASLSKEMLTDKLRGELGFDGIIITDSLKMGAITKHFSAGDAAVKAFSAGADILLMPSDFVAAYKAVLAAVNSGSITQMRLDESVLRILELKEKYGIIGEYNG